MNFFKHLPQDITNIVETDHSITETAAPVLNGAAFTVNAWNNATSLLTLDPGTYLVIAQAQSSLITGATAYEMLLSNKATNDPGLLSILLSSNYLKGLLTSPLTIVSVIVIDETNTDLYLKIKPLLFTGDAFTVSLKAVRLF